ncbi:hypothetical protein [Rhodococcus sp. NPDC058521]|uniref:hypothetical protein n=1 Tax=Rhodococcus sp. NPDC058521 TaxID=3346536 RepID=UPI003650E2E2
MSILTDVPGFLDAPNSAEQIQVDQETVKVHSLDPTSVKFETANGGWRGSHNVAVSSDPATGEPSATDDQTEATATEIVKILEELKGPDREVKHC